MLIFFKINRNFKLILEFTPYFVECLKKLKKLKITPHLPQKGLSFHHFYVVPPFENADFWKPRWVGHHFWTIFEIFFGCRKFTRFSISLAIYFPVNPSWPKKWTSRCWMNFALSIWLRCQQKPALSSTNALSWMLARQQRTVHSSKTACFLENIQLSQLRARQVKKRDGYKEQRARLVCTMPSKTKKRFLHPQRYFTK